MAQLVRIDAHLDTLSDKLCQVNTCVGHIAQRQAAMGDFTTTSSPSPLPQASADEDGDDGADDDDEAEDEDASSSSDEEMMTSW